MKAFIQTKDNGEWLNENCYLSAHGFDRMGYEIVKFTYDNIYENDPYGLFGYFDEDVDIVHGGILGVRKVFDLLNKPQPEIHNPHDYLYDYIGRTMGEDIFGNIVLSFTQNKINPIFIKPLYDHKLFTGKVINEYVDLIPLSGTPYKTKVLTSEVVNYISEYRCFVNRKKLIGCKNYTGDFTVLPNFDLV